MKASNHNSFETRFVFIVLLLFLSIVSFGQHKKMPKLKNPSGQGFIPCGSCEQPSNIASETTISIGEKGEPLTISGTVYKADGKTPASGIILFFYHTDATGHYNNEDDPNDPRLKGWVKTGADGHYKFTTIKPAPYPKLTTPAHIHVHLFNKDLPENYIDDFWFTGDTLIKDSEKKRFESLGNFSPIVMLTRDTEGMLNGTRNIRLK
jgi:protocatechuate 3,4-dioxygenase beta subunit